jgi:hypothetical protein
MRQMSTSGAAGAVRDGTAGERRIGAVRILKRIFGVLIVPALVMVGMARIAPNPDGALVLALLWMVGTDYCLKR